MYSKKSKIIMLLLVISMIATQFTMFTPTALAADVELLITGTGVNEDVSITSSDWSKYSILEKTYSTNNSLGFHKIVKAKGYDLFSLIGESNLKTDKDYVVKFTCSDGFEFTKTISELKNAYYYKDFTEASKVNAFPMIAKYTQILADFPKDSFAPPVAWTDQVINEENIDKDFPKLVFGQIGIDDMNMSKWGKEVVKITIGDEKKVVSDSSLYKHINKKGNPYNVDAITGATFTIEGPGVEGYRAISLRQIEEDVIGQKLETHFEKIDGKVMQNSYEGINVKYLIDNYVDAKDNAGNITFKDKSRKTIMTVPIEEAENYVVAYGVNEIPLVYLNTEEGYIAEKHNDDGCFKLVYEQYENTAKEFSNVAYIYIEEKDAKNINEHSYAPYNDSKFTDYEFIIHGDGIGKEVRYTVLDIESMTEIQTTMEYSLSNSEYFWYYNSFKGVPLWDLLVKAGLDPNIDENTSVRFIAADNYNFAPMTIKEIKDDSLYGYYEKSAMDTGDGTFPGEYVNPIYKDMPVLVAYGFNGYPYVTRPGDEGYNPGLGNDGGPLRIIFGKTNYNDTNGSNQVQFAKEVIIGEGTSVLTDSQETGEGQTTQTEITENSSWSHNQGLYTEYLDMPVLRVTGSQVKEPITFTLRQLEALNAVRDVYTGDGVHEFEGVVLWDIISQVVGLKDDVEVPSIRVFSGENYNQILRSNDQVVNGVLNSKGQLKDIILAYAIDGYPLVENEGDFGYINNNAYGPLRLIVEESKSMWVKWTDCIVVGTGDYEAPEMEDVKEDNVLFNDISNHWANSDILDMASLGYVNGSDGMFRPEDNITRAEFVSLVVRVLGIDSLGTLNASFTDVNEGNWYSKDVLLAASNGLVKGYEDGTFKPNAPITREEIGSIIGTQLNENLTAQQSDEILSSYTDEISGWAKNSVASAVKAEIIKGLPDNLFGGRQNATRAQASVMLLRFLNNK
ncbi:MAG: S-layer homology domain-containing protein [Sedimentibacter sp.]